MVDFKEFKEFSISKKFFDDQIYQTSNILFFILQVSAPVYDSNDQLFDSMENTVDTLDVTNVQEASGQIQSVLSQLTDPNEFVSNGDETGGGGGDAGVDGEGGAGTLEENTEVIMIYSKQQY